MAKKIYQPLIPIFDLDNTLGWKTPTYPNITKNNGDFLHYFSLYNNAKSIFATGRPRTQARVGLQKGNIQNVEIYKIFSGGVFEDGLFVENKDGEIYNALNESPEGFKKMRNAFFSEKAKIFFDANGYVLFPDCVVRQKEKNGKTFYEKLDYDENLVSEIIQDLPKNFKGILYEQGNDVRATYKAPIGFGNDELEKQRPFFDELEPFIKEFMEKQGDYDNHTTLVKWEDALEIYPVLGKEVFRKGIGVEMILEKIDPNRESKLIFCCDGKNDISLVTHLEKNYNNFLIVIPSNASSGLVEKIFEMNKNEKRGYILKEDCTKFGNGFIKLLREMDYID